MSVLRSLLYLALAIGFWLGGIILYNYGVTDWSVSLFVCPISVYRVTCNAPMQLSLTTPIYYCIQKSPAGSRNNNQECVVLGFFDTHDLWHFLSSFALFFSFLVSSELYTEIYLEWV